MVNIITGEQVRSARAMLRLEQSKFAALMHVSLGTVRRMERTRGPVKASAGVLDVFRHALEAAGVELIDAGPYEGTGGPGVRLAGTPAAPSEIIDFETAVEEIGREAAEVPLVS